MNQWVAGGLDLLYPRVCIRCDGAVDAGSHQHLCWECHSQIQVLQPPCCIICGTPVYGRVEDDYICGLCTKNEPAYEEARAAARYDGVMRDLIHAFKYKEALWVQHDLVQILETAYRVYFASKSIQYIAAVPLFRARRRERGYNQSHLLGLGLARKVGIPYWPQRRFRRIRPTISQTRLTGTERGSNVQGAFQAKRLNRKGLGPGVLLIDDVMTTGATVHECAVALKDCGVQNVYVLTLARG